MQGPKVKTEANGANVFVEKKLALDLKSLALSHELKIIKMKVEPE